MTITLSAMFKKLVAVALIIFLSIAPAQALHSVDKYVNSKQLAAPGLLVMNPADGSILAQNAPESLRIPASVLKLITTTTALHFITPEKQYVTKIYNTAATNEFVIKGEMDPWLTSNLSFSKKNNQRFLPSLITKANTGNFKKLKVYYLGLYEKDTTDLAFNLKQKGVKVEFEKINKDLMAQLVVQEVATLTSEPLTEMVKYVNLWSDNRLADRLAKEAAQAIGYKATAKGLTTTFKQAMSELGVDHIGLQVKDGSGLSKQNQVSARTVVELLMRIRGDIRYQAVYEGLPIAGKTGTLQKRFLTTAPNAVGMVKAKTGWVNNSVTLAGYVVDGEKEYVFAILADGITPSLTARNKARAAMDRLLGSIVKGNH
jgi:D-alanyl-D-alanine carboxypeptidase/D-alanyl-D-alanine-endopeptidase (penicillin-binding protein 4)